MTSSSLFTSASESFHGEVFVATSFVEGSMSNSDVSSNTRNSERTSTSSYWRGPEEADMEAVGTTAKRGGATSAGATVATSGTGTTVEGTHVRIRNHSARLG